MPKEYSSVYLLVDKEQGRIKIGKANDIFKRWECFTYVSIDHTSSYELICSNERAAHKIEKMTQYAFDEYKINPEDIGDVDGKTEWFEISILENVIDFLKDRSEKDRRVLEFIHGMDNPLRRDYEIKIVYKTIQNKIIELDPIESAVLLEVLVHYTAVCRMLCFYYNSFEEIGQRLSLPVVLVQDALNILLSKSIFTKTTHFQQDSFWLNSKIFNAGTWKDNFAVCMDLLDKSQYVTKQTRSILTNHIHKMETISLETQNNTKPTDRFEAINESDKSNIQIGRPNVDDYKKQDKRCQFYISQEMIDALAPIAFKNGCKDVTAYAKKILTDEFNKVKE